MPLSPKHYLQAPFDVAVDKKRIETYYKVKGYHRAKVTAAEIKPYKGQQAVDVHFTIDEGAPIYIHQIVWDGIEALEPKEIDPLRAQLSISIGQILDDDEYLKQKENVFSFLRKKGYAFAKVNSHVDVNRDTRQADIRFFVNPGPKAVFGQVIIKGAKKTDPVAIVERVAIPTGQPFRQESLDAAQEKLYQLGSFATVRAEVEPNLIHPHVADVVITVTEGAMNAAKVGVGIEFESGRVVIPLKTEYTRYNFFGGLRTFRVTGKVGYAWLWSPKYSSAGPEVELTAELLQPDILGKNSELLLRLGFHLGVEYPFQDYGPFFHAGVIKSFFQEHLQLGISYDFLFLNFFGVNPSIIQTDPTLAGRLFGYHSPYHLGYFQESIIVDFRDSKIDPNQGFYGLLTIEEGGPYAGSAFTYEKLVPEIRGYVSLGSRVTLAGRVMFGQIFSQGDLGSPITQRFYLGGPNSHRGFNYNRLSPPYIPNLKEYAQGQSGSAPFPIGGDQMFLFQAEVRVRLAKIYDQWFSIVGFLDGGDVGAPACSDKSCQVSYEPKVDFTNLHYAAGLGLRYKTIIGTIRFDVGVRLNRISLVEPGCVSEDTRNCIFNPDGKDEILNRFAFHLSIGEAF